MNDPSKNLLSAPANVSVDVIDDLPLPYLEMDRAGKITRANRAAFALHPHEQGELVGRMAWDLVAADEKKSSSAAYFALMESGEEPPVVTRSIYTRSGEYRIYELHRALVLDANGRPAGMRMVCTDLTELKRALEEAHHACQWLESMLASAADAVIVTDALGFIRTVNPAAEALLGWTSKELIGRAVEKRLPMLKFVSDGKTHLSFTMTLESHCKGLAVILDHESREVHVEITTSPILDRDSGFTNGVISVLRQLKPE